LLLLICAVIEFGIYFAKSQIAQRAMSNVSAAVRNNPADPNIIVMAGQTGMSFVDFKTSPNYFCAKPYTSLEAAKTGSCASSDWDLTMPKTTVAGEPYYVALTAYAEHRTPINLFGKFLPDIRERNIIQVNTSTNPIIGAKIYTPVSVSSVQLSAASWTADPGLQISYTPKSDFSTLKLTYKFHIAGGYNSSDCPFTVYSYKLYDAYASIDIPGKVGQMSGCKSDTEEQVVFYMSPPTEGWKKQRVKYGLSLKLYTAGYPSYLYRYHIYENKGYAGNAINAPVGLPTAEILEMQFSE
jgi:hypothetical protein